MAKNLIKTQVIGMSLCLTENLLDSASNLAVYWLQIYLLFCCCWAAKSLCCSMDCLVLPGGRPGPRFFSGSDFLMLETRLSSLSFPPLMAGGTAAGAVSVLSGGSGAVVADVVLKGGKLPPGFWSWDGVSWGGNGSVVDVGLLSDFRRFRAEN